MNSGAPFWEQHEWWAQRGVIEVSLAELTKRFAVNTPEDERGGAHPTWFGGELQRWCRLLGQREWVRDDIGANAAMLATQGVRNRYHHSAAWDSISVLLGRYARHLARYSVSFTDAVHEWRPVVGHPHADPIRERARSVANDMRAALVGDSRPGGGVLDTEAAALRFVSNTEIHRDRDTVTAINAYAQRLVQYKADAGGGDDELRSAIDLAVEQMSDEFGLSVDGLEAGVRRPVAGLRDKAASLVFAVALDKPKAQNTDFYDELIARSIKKVENRLAEGEALPDADMIFNRTWGDLHKETRRTRTLKVDLVNTDADEEIADPRGGDEGYLRAESHVEQKLLLRAAADYLRDVTVAAPGATDPMFWEKDVALQILTGGTGVGDFTKSASGRDVLIDVRRHVVDRWKEAPDLPVNALCRNQIHAAKFVSGLVRIAVAHALADVTDFPDWIGRDSAEQSWSQRIATVDAALADHRTQTPQRLFDTIRDGDRK